MKETNPKRKEEKMMSYVSDLEKYGFNLREWIKGSVIRGCDIFNIVRDGGTFESSIAAAQESLDKAVANLVAWHELLREEQEKVVKKGRAEILQGLKKSLAEDAKWAAELRKALEVLTRAIAIARELETKGELSARIGSGKYTSGLSFLEYVQHTIQESLSSKESDYCQRAIQELLAKSVDELIDERKEGLLEDVGYSAKTLGETRLAQRMAQDWLASIDKVFDVLEKQTVEVSS